MPKPEYKPETDQVTWTEESIKTAEEIVGAEMYNPKSPEEMAKVKKIYDSPEYTVADSDDETEDVKETKRSVQWAENELK